MSDVSAQLPIRERKRERTRRQLVEHGTRLIRERGYDGATIADIAAAAEIGTRTFFAYFESKEQLLFPDRDPRVDAALAAIQARRDEDTPLQLLLRSLSTQTFDAEASSPAAQLRMELMYEVPAIQARVLRSQLDAQRVISEALTSAYPDADRLDLAALVGAFMGAVAAAFQHLTDASDPHQRKHRVQDAVAAALRPAS